MRICQTAILTFLKLTNPFTCKVISTTPQQIFYDIFVEIDVDDSVVQLVTLVGLTGCDGCLCGCWAYLKGKTTHKTRVKNGKYRFNVVSGEYVLSIPKMCYKTKVVL